MQLTLTPGALLNSPPDGPIDVPVELWGFGGLHGGLAVALVLADLVRNTDVSSLRHVSAVFHHGVRDRIKVSSELVRSGSGITTATGRIDGLDGPSSNDGPSVSGRPSATARPSVTATAVFGPSIEAAPVRPPRPPSGIGRPADWDSFEVPREFVPFAAHTEIRPVGTALPFLGGPEPELVAWIRLVEDDRPPDVLRFLVLVDALAPSYAAILTDVAPIPTVELSARPGDGLDRAESPWVLVSARTTSASGGGWLDEQIDVWGVDGDHLGSSRQLRMVRSGRERVTAR